MKKQSKALTIIEGIFFLKAQFKISLCCFLPHLRTTTGGEGSTHCKNYE